MSKRLHGFPEIQRPQKFARVVIARSDSARRTLPLAFGALVIALDSNAGDLSIVVCVACTVIEAAFS